jgi:hypothetical protein
VGSWVSSILLEEAAATMKGAHRCSNAIWFVVAALTCGVCGVWTEAVVAACSMSFSHPFQNPHISVGVDGSIFYFDAPISAILMLLAFAPLATHTRWRTTSSNNSSVASNTNPMSTNSKSTPQRQQSPQPQPPPQKPQNLVVCKLLRHTAHLLFLLGSFLAALCVMVAQELARHALRTEAACSSPAEAWIVGVVVAWVFTAPAMWIFFYVRTPKYRSFGAVVLATGMICSIFTSLSQIKCWWAPNDQNDNVVLGRVWAARHGSTLNTSVIIIATAAFAAILGFSLLVATSLRLRLSRSVLAAALHRMEKSIKTVRGELETTQDQLNQSNGKVEELRLQLALINNARPLDRQPWAAALAMSATASLSLPRTVKGRFEKPVGAINRDTFHQLVGAEPARKELKLKDVMGNPITLELLKDCATEGRESENLMFLLDVHYFSAITDPDLLWELARRIFDTYIGGNAKFPINIGVQIRNGISAQMQACGGRVVAIFDQAEMEIYNLVLHNTWPRFCATPAYNVACQLLVRQQQQQQQEQQQQHRTPARPSDGNTASVTDDSKLRV